MTADPRETAPGEVWAGVAADRRRAVVFDCVGKPGMLDSILGWIPTKGRVVIAGMCMVPDTFNPILGFTKEITIAYASGYSVREFEATLDHIAGDPSAVEPFITGRTGLDGIGAAFDRLAAADTDAKIMVRP